MADEERLVRQTCTDHCATCGGHFHGLGAFDAHRMQGACYAGFLYDLINTKGTRLLQVWTEEGYCDKEKGCWADGKRDHYSHPVTIWQTFKSEEALQRLQELGGRKSGAGKAKAV